MKLSTTTFTAALLASGLCYAGPRDFVVEHTGAGATAQTAQPYIEQFLRLVEPQLGWPAGGSKGEWVDDAKQAAAVIADKKPGFAILDPEVYLELRKRDGMEPIAMVKGKTFNKGHYSLVVKDPSLKTVADLKGKKVASNHVASPKYLAKVAFDGKVDPEKDFELVKTASPLKPLKSVLRGEAAAALIDDEQLANLKALPDGETLKVIWTSPPLPPTPVVALRGAAAADRAAMAKVLTKVCSDAKGKPVCESMFIDQFAPVDKDAFSESARRYDK